MAEEITPQASPAGKTYHCGTLTYTKFGIVTLFAWLLWGDFCFTLMEAVVPALLPLKLKALEAPNWLIALILTTIPNVFSMTLCPYISFKSDRFRSRWGRRRPFIIFSTPFLCASLGALAYSDQLGRFAQGLVAAGTVSPLTIMVAVIAFIIIVFQIFNMFVGSVIGCLFNDVVPVQFLGRFLGLFRIVGTAAGAFFSYFLYQYAESNYKEIILGASLLYLFGFGLMCLMVKEGEYPPIVGEDDPKNKGFLGDIKTFVKETYSDKFYWMFFLYSTSSSIGAVFSPFNVFYYKEMGLNLALIGKFSAVASVVTMASMYFASIFVDRWHPMRVALYSMIFVAVHQLFSWVWFFTSIPGVVFFWLNIGACVAFSFQSALVNVCSQPLQMRIFPKSRYGQFCSGQQIIRSILVILGSVLAGMLLDYLQKIYTGTAHGANYAYRFAGILPSIFVGISAFFLIKFYFAWHKQGGFEGYHPLARWSASGVEEIEISPVRGPNYRWLKIGLDLFNWTIGLSFAGIIPMVLWLYSRGAFFAMKWHALVIFPLAGIVWIMWRMVQKGIYADIELVRKGQAPRYGIVHHGIIIVVGITNLVTLAVWVAQIVVTAHLHLETDVVVFGLGNLTNNLLLVGAVQLIRWIERGRTVIIDMPGQPITVGA